MVDVHTFEVYPTVEELNEAVGRAFLARLNALIDEAGADSRVNLAISGGAITTSLLPSLLPFVGDVDWSRVRVWLVDERYVPAGDEDRNDDQSQNDVDREHGRLLLCLCEQPQTLLAGLFLHILRSPSLVKRILLDAREKNKIPFVKLL